MTTTVIRPEIFESVRVELAAFVQQKLDAMELGATDVELHNSASTKSFRIYVTLKRTTNIKALYLAEQMLSKEIAQKFHFAPYTIYWRYRPDPLAVVTGHAEATG
jgi:hypothetical protein